MHAYQLREKEAFKASVRVDKLGSPNQTIVIRTVVLERTGDERTAARIRFDADGQAVEVSDLFVSLVNVAESRMMEEGR